MFFPDEALIVKSSEAAGCEDVTGVLWELSGRVTAELVSAAKVLVIQIKNVAKNIIKHDIMLLEAIFNFINIYLISKQ